MTQSPGTDQAALSALSQEVEQLKEEREALRSARDTAFEEQAGDTGPPEAIKDRLRTRIDELIRKLAAGAVRPDPKTSPDHSPAGPSQAEQPQAAPEGVPAQREGGTQKARPAVTGNPVDPIALADALLRSGDCESALEAYRRIELNGLRSEDRIAVQYMTATCLRRLGKVQEAASLYREVANAKGSDRLIDCARWQLGAIEGRRALGTHIEQLRGRRLALE